MSKITTKDIVDMFISDCLLPTTGKGQVLAAKDLYGYYLSYCEYAQKPPTSKIHFGRCMAERFKPSKRQGRNHYYCELNKNVIDMGDENDQQENV